MEFELNFKEKTDGLSLAEENKSQGLTVLQKKTNDRYATLSKQKRKASIDVEYLKKGSKRRNHVFAFADNYRPVTAKECRNFYKKNPGDFENEKSGRLVFGSIAVVVSSLAMLGGFMGFMNEANLSKASVLASLSALEAFGAFWGLWSLADWARMSLKGPKSLKAKPDDFLRIFERDKNLKKLWFEKRGEATVLSQKSYKKKEKDLKRINAYRETKNWLQQWSEGDVDRLRKVEWLTLCGIAKKYGKHLTPVDWGQECADSSV